MTATAANPHIDRDLHYLSWLPRQMAAQEHGNTRYLFEASHCSLPLYFALKGKHGYALANPAPFIAEVQRQLAAVAGAYDLVVYPESRFPFLRLVTQDLSHALELKKRTKADVRARVMASRKWSRLERESQERAFAEMGDAFTMNLVKSNQRQHYAPHVFVAYPVAPGTRVLLLDDFIMSGMTLRALAAALGCETCDVFGVFAQVPER